MVTAAADLRRMAVFSRKNKGHKPWVNRRPWKPSTGVLQHLIKAPPVSFLGAGGGELLPTELAALDSILGDDTVISLGGGEFVLLTSVWSDAASMACWTGVHRASRLEIFQTPGTPFSSHTGPPPLDNRVTEATLQPLTQRFSLGTEMWLTLLPFSHLHLSAKGRGTSRALL